MVVGFPNINVFLKSDHPPKVILDNPSKRIIIYLLGKLYVLSKLEPKTLKD